MQANPLVDLTRPAKLDLSELRYEHSAVKPTDGQPYWHVKLRLQQDITEENNSPYSFRISIEGLFQLVPDFPIEQSDRFVTINGVSILYGIAREQLRQAMSAGPIVPIMLPSVTFAPEVSKNPAVTKLNE